MFELKTRLLHKCMSCFFVFRRMFFAVLDKFGLFWDEGFRLIRALAVANKLLGLWVVYTREYLYSSLAFFAGACG